VQYITTPIDFLWAAAQYIIRASQI